MSEFWKSLPRKFCEICKCWFADNKASIDFHERGKRHQENAAKRIQDIQKRGQKEFKKQKKLEGDMAKIEKAALAAYRKDLQNQATSPLEANLAEKSLNVISEVCSESHFVQPIKKNENKRVVKKKEIPKVITKVWYEALTDEGYKYYWNTENSESKWEPPEDGFISLEEQEQMNSEKSSQEDKILAGEDSNSENTTKAVVSVGPLPKVDPYGQWITVENKKPEEIDYELPKPSEDLVEVVIPVAKNEPKLRIKEKVIGQLTDTDSSEEVTFKKRKFTGSFKRNARQRTIEDD